MHRWFYSIAFVILAETRFQSLFILSGVTTYLKNEWWKIFNDDDSFNSAVGEKKTPTAAYGVLFTEHQQWRKTNTDHRNAEITTDNNSIIWVNLPS
jgi:hypothetical protein